MFCGPASSKEKRTDYRIVIHLKRNAIIFLLSATSQIEVLLVVGKNLSSKRSVCQINVMTFFFASFNEKLDSGKTKECSLANNIWSRTEAAKEL